MNRQSYYFFAGGLPRLKEVRIERGWSIRKLAQQAGVAPSTVYEIERGVRRAHDRTAQKLAKALGIERAELVIPAEEVEARKVQDEAGSETLPRQLVPLMLIFTDRELKEVLLDSPLRRRVIDLVEREQLSRSVEEETLSEERATDKASHGEDSDGPEGSERDDSPR